MKRKIQVTSADEFVAQYMSGTELWNLTLKDSEHSEVFKIAEELKDQDTKYAFLYAWCLEFGYGCRKDTDQAQTIFAREINYDPNPWNDSESSDPAKMVELAEAGDADSQLELALSYENGSNGKKMSGVKAFEWMHKAADKGNVEALLNTAFYYQCGFGVDEDPSSSVKYFMKAAALGSDTACFHLGECYAEGYGVERDIDEAVKWYCAAGGDRFEPAKIALARLFYNHLSNDVRCRQIFENFKADADKGDPQCCFAMFKVYQTAADEETKTAAFEYCRSAAERAVVEAYSPLGFCYLFGFGTEKNFAVACEWLETAGKYQDSSAFLFLGKAYESEELGHVDISKAISYYKKSAHLGEDLARDCLGDIYFEGRGVPQNGQKALYYYEREVCKDPLTLFRIGFIYFTGFSVPVSFKKGYENLKKAAQLNYRPAYEFLGHYFLDAEEYDEAIRWLSQLEDPKSVSLTALAYILRHNGPQDIAKAEEILLREIDKGRLQAGHNLGLLYSRILPEAKNFTKASKFFELSAEAGNIQDYAYLGKLWRNKNIRQAVKYFEKGAEKSDLTSILELFRIYSDENSPQYNEERALLMCRRGMEMESPAAYTYMAQAYLDEALGLEKDAWQAYKLLKHASETGFVNATIGLADLYLYGEGVKKNPQKALALYKKCLGQDDGRAAFKLGVIYEEGLGFPQNISKAAKYYEEAAEAGYKNALLFLGQMYMNHGEYENAITVYEKAVEAKLPEAQSNLSKAYFLGRKSEQKRSFDYFNKNPNDPFSAFMLACCYSLGLGVDVDLAEAGRCLKLSAEAGFTEAIVKYALALAGMSIDKMWGDSWLMEGALQLAASDFTPELSARILELLEKAAAQGSDSATALIENCARKLQSVLS